MALHLYFFIYIKTFCLFIDEVQIKMLDTKLCQVKPHGINFIKILEIYRKHNNIKYSK